MDPRLHALLGDSPDFQNFLIIKSYQTKLIDKYTKGKLPQDKVSKYIEKIAQWTRVLDRRYNKQ